MAKKKNTKKSPSKGNTSSSGLFKFRRYKKIEGGKNRKARHPKLIVEQNDNTVVGFMGLTEKRKSGHHANIPLDHNPKKGDSRDAYIRKELRHDDLSNFSDILNNYNLSERDKLKVIAYLEKLKKKK